MKKKHLGQTLDVSPLGVWFDGRGHKGRTEPELISILRKSTDFLNDFGSSIIDEIEVKRKDVASGAELQREISELKKGFIVFLSIV